MQKKWAIYSALILCYSFFVIYSLITLSGNLWWDTSVYVGMAKFIFSYGTQGLWEPARPILWPLMIGILHSFSFDAVLSAKVMGIFFTLLLSFFTFLVGRELYGEKAALLASITLLFSPTIFSFSSSGLTDIPSAAIALLSVYLFMKKRYFFSGLFAGIASMARFLHLFGGIIIGIFLVYEAARKFSLKNLRKFLIGAVIAVFPYLLLNTFLYGNPLYPFFLQSFLTKVTGWLNYQSAYYYLVLLIRENFFSVLSLGGILLIAHKPNKNRILSAVMLAFYFLFFSLIPQKEPRFFITFLPYVYIFSAGFILSFKLGKFKLPIYTLLLLGMAIQVVPQLAESQHFEDYSFFQSYAAQDNVTSGIWISNPSFIVYTGKKADELIYYPTITREQINRLESRLRNARHILISTCDIQCPPSFPDCETAKKSFLAGLRQNFLLEKYAEKDSCEYFIYAATSSP